LNEGGKENVHFSMENWTHHRNDERYGVGYYKSLLGSSIRSVRLNRND